MTQAQNSKYTLRLTPGRLLGWGLLTLFLLGWMFVLGILVGRGTVTVPRKSQALSNELAELKANALQAERDAIEAMAKASADQNLSLKYPEELKKAPPKSTAPPRPSPTPAKPKAVVQAKPAAGPPAAKKPVAAPTAAAVAAAAVQVPAKGRFTVQVAALRDLESANKLVATLRGKGYAAYQIRSENAAKEAWFRVRVGAFDNRPEADATLKKLQGEKFKAMVVGTN